MPAANAFATSCALKLPLKLSGAMTIFISFSPFALNVTYSSFVANEKS